MAETRIIVDPALERVGAVIVQDMKRLLQEYGSVDTGNLINSIEYKVKDNVLYILMEPYGVFVDKGTRGRNTGLPDRKMPPISALKGWASRRGINVWALAKSIQLWGTQARPFTTSLKEFEKQYFPLLENKMVIELDMFIDKFIMDIKNRL